jgi:hypothetical protein
MNWHDGNRSWPEAPDASDPLRLNLRPFAERPCCPQDVEDRPTTICANVLQAAHRETERIDATPRTLRPELKRRVEAMLGLISYCYAKGLFDSAEIARRLWREEAFLATFGNDIPSAKSIRCFRRKHRENILAVIEQALQEYRQRTSTVTPSARQDAGEPASESVRLKAQHLVQMASIMDQAISE